jgi:hypothetical protein
LSHGQIGKFHQKISTKLVLIRRLIVEKIARLDPSQHRSPANYVDDTQSTSTPVYFHQITLVAMVCGKLVPAEPNTNEIEQKTQR